MHTMAAVLIAAHMIADFVLQPDRLVSQKHKPRFLFLHAGIHAVIAYLALQLWACWLIPPYVFGVHALIDSAKRRWGGDTVRAFVLDQAAHVLSLFLLAGYLARFCRVTTFTGRGYGIIVLAGGFCATVFGAGYLIAIFARRLTEDNALELDGLENGGKYIGQLERTLIFLFVIIGHPAGIGFLVAAKSILRFEEAKKQKLAEYVLIGTLLSFSLAVALAAATRWALRF